MDVCNKSTIGGDLDMKAGSSLDFHWSIFVGRFLKGRSTPFFFVAISTRGVGAL